LGVIKSLLGNKVLISALFSWFMAQFIKIVIEIIKRNKLKTKDFILRAIFGTGGIPSSHSASITAVAVSIGFESGFGSPLFALAIVLVIIVIRDATGVRLSAGTQANKINQILEKIKDGDEIGKVKEVRGHTPLECFVGLLVGLLVSLGIYLIK